MDTKRIGRRIKAFRKLKGYTQTSFANEINLPIAVLGPIERGTKKPSEELLSQIADTLYISKEELLVAGETVKED
ncbi:helix-turn-helix domain-containing protein [Virgibacillus byunsanensis]|uniref:Helix-turn-helix domain-containing protein n=1 Tax=Virgibacillus byunsanensis TaxID=570945 RepID=A0ABW3LSE3_9BACI